MEKKKKFDVKIVKKLFPYIWQEKWLFIAGLSMMLVTSVLRLLDPLIIAHILDHIVPDKNISELYLYAGLFVGIVVVSGLLTYFQIITLAKMGVKIITRLKFQVFDHFLKLPVKYFDYNPVGELIARVESDCENVRQLFSELSVMILGNLLFFSGMVTVMFLRNWNITIILMIPISIIVVSVFFVARYLSRFFRRVRELNADITGVMTEYIQGISIIQLFNRQDKVAKILDEKAREKKNIDARAMFTEYSFWGLYGFLLETVIVVLLVYLMVPQILIGAVTIGTLIVFVQYSQRIFWPLLMISENINQIQRAFASLQRIFGILALLPETDGLKNSITPHFNEKIEFRNVWFQYKEDEWVLKDVSFTINKGEKIALVGASGSGKTTTVSLLCQFYQVQQGGIYVDGINLNELEMKKWRQKIGLVLQDIYLFPGDIRENIRIYNDDISEQEIEKSLHIVRADDFLKKQPDGIYSEIKERGQNVSVGEKQLLSFARAMVFSPELIILDEATASVDIRTEARIQKAIETILHDKTAVIVAHRLSSVVNADKILLFQDGRIIDQGSHNELLVSSPEYKKLVELQFLHQEEAG
ncbi:MAG: ABC transporter ATP-binding protein/permease [Candidatus Cloacimonetes bacterium]|nr:ABC transporter ATP-binding protein/permease [Candidatus Cloacimonadota bacterium]